MHEKLLGGLLVLCVALGGPPAAVGADPPAIVQWQGVAELVRQHKFPCDEINAVTIIRRLSFENDVVVGNVRCDDHHHYRIVWVDGAPVSIVRQLQNSGGSAVRLRPESASPSL